MPDRHSVISVDGPSIRAFREASGLSAAALAEIVGLYDDAKWRRWEREGVKGTAAVLLRALIESRQVRRYFGLSL